MKTSDSDLKVSRSIYPDAVTCDRMRLIGPKSGQLGPINHCLCFHTLMSVRRKKLSVYEKNAAPFSCCGKTAKSKMIPPRECYIVISLHYMN